MTPYYSDDWLTVYQGDCREVMASMEPESVQCVVTSPPYWGLRDYGTATWVGGDDDHEHHGVVARTGPAGTPKQASHRGSTDVFSGDCLCGAIREDGQLGLEPTPEAYVASMVEVFREVRRVLRDDGTVWLNLGDSYARAQSTNVPQTINEVHGYPDHSGLASKQLVGIPWRVAFALQADGWYLRSDIIWSKPNPMPESVTDRPTKSHEYLFLLSKSARYHFDAAAVRIPAADASLSRWAQKIEDQVGSDRANGGAKTNGTMKAVGGPRRTDKQRGHSRRHAGFNDRWDEMERDEKVAAGANIRSVWTIATQPYPGAHFATFPPKLVEPCIKAGCPSGGVVLDPFAGSGTTGMVAQALGRRAVLIDLNGEYLTQAMRRNQQSPLGLDVA